MILKSLLSPSHENPRISDGCLDMGPIIESQEACKRMMYEKLCGPRVHSFILTQNPKVLDEYSNENFSLDLMNAQ